MTTHLLSHGITVETLAEVVSQWPRYESDGTSTMVLIGNTFPDCSFGMEPVMLVGVIKGTQSLCLSPKIREIPSGSLAPNADALSLAMAAMRYQLTTSPAQYDPEIANGLFYRAIVAIEKVTDLERGLAQ